MVFPFPPLFFNLSSCCCCCCCFVPCHLVEALKSYALLFLLDNSLYDEGPGPQHSNATQRWRHCSWTAWGTQVELRPSGELSPNSAGLTTEAFLRLAGANGSAPDVPKTAKSWPWRVLASLRRMHATWLKSPTIWGLRKSQSSKTLILQTLQWGGNKMTKRQTL